MMIESNGKYRHLDGDCVHFAQMIQAISSSKASRKESYDAVMQLTNLVVETMGPIPEEDLGTPWEKLPNKRWVNIFVDDKFTSVLSDIYINKECTSRFFVDSPHLPIEVSIYMEKSSAIKARVEKATKRLKFAEESALASNAAKEALIKEIAQIEAEE